MERFAKTGDFCPHPDCSEYGNIQDEKQKNIQKYGKTKRCIQRYHCRICKRTSTATTGTLFYGKHTSEDEILETLALLAEALWQENDLIFPSSIGTPMDPRNLFRLFKELLKQADLPNIRFHDLRHTAATLMLQQGVHPKVVQERLGHADISLTLNTYSHVLPTMQDEAADKIDELLCPIDISQEIQKLSEQSVLYKTINRR